VPNDQNITVDAIGTGLTLAAPGVGDASPVESPVLALLRDVHRQFLPVSEGSVATYIPELGRVAPDQFGIALVTADGHVYEVGESREPFTIQSISKPLVYGLALHDHGRDAVLARIGVEPSGDQFNAIVFDDRRNRPFNAMVNTGAIVATSLVRGDDAADRMGRILEFMRVLSGHPVEVDEAVYRSEAATGNRNRAIAYLELNNGMIEGEVETHLDLYFRQCAMLTSATDLAFIAATLARGGRHPVTGKRALATEHVRDVLSVMTTCGMYDYAGEWELRVGLPAKSGVGGGIMAVLPGQLGIGIFSPRLDEYGNPLRGIRACEELSRRLQLHLLDYRGRTRPGIRRTYSGADVHSTRVRSVAARAILDAAGGAIRVFELQGNLFFGNTEQAVRRVLRTAGLRHLILDMGRVTSVEAVAANLLRELHARLVAAGVTVKLAAVPQEFRHRLGIDGSAYIGNAERALEACEDTLLQAQAPAEQERAGDVPLRHFELLAELTGRELEILAEHLELQTYAAGQTIIAEGTPADSLYFLAAGSVDVRVVRQAEKTVTHLASVDAGNVVGELALLGQRTRTAAVVAATPVRVWALRAAEFTPVSRDYPEIRAKLLTAVGQSLSERLRRANAIIQSLVS
jgi:glutaminase